MSRDVTLPPDPKPVSGFLLRVVLPVVALLVIVGAAYHEAPGNRFHLDDGWNILDNPAIRITELTVENLFDAGRHATQRPRPLASMTFAIDWWRGNGDPRPFQWTNIVIHGAATLSVFALLVLVLRRFGYRQRSSLAAAFFAAALWAGHPIQVQAVTYISQRMASMVALFIMLTVVFYLLGRSARSSGWRIAWFVSAAVAFLLGLATKENAAVVPALLLLAEYGVLRHGRRLVRSKLDIALLCLPPAVLLLVALDLLTGAGPLTGSFVTDYRHRDFTLVERLMTQPRVIGFHLGQILWPLPGRFSLEHDFAVSTGLFAPPSTTLAFAGVALWCAAGLWTLFRARWRIVGFFLLWVPATLAIESSFVALEMVFEHRMYLPLAGLVGLVSLAAAWCLEKSWRARTPAVAALVVLVLGLSLSTRLQLPVWRTQESLSRNSLLHAPNSARAWADLGVALVATGRGEEGEPALRKSLELDPDQKASLVMLAIRMMDVGELDEARRLMERRMNLGLPEPRAMNTFGEVLLKQGDPVYAAYYFRSAAEWYPRRPVYRWNLALAYEQAGNCKAARQEWLAYLRVEPVEDQRSVVRAHLEEHYETAGGKCFGALE
jgi:hypothetical protein